LQKKEWTSEEVTFLIDHIKRGYSRASIAQSLDRTFASINTKVTNLQSLGILERLGPGEIGKHRLAVDVKLETVDFPVYNDAFRVDVQDFIAFSDVHTPFWHKGLFQKMFPIAEKFKIKTAFIIGDFLNLDTFSNFETARKSPGKCNFIFWCHSTSSKIET